MELRRREAQLEAAAARCHALAYRARGGRSSVQLYAVERVQRRLLAALCRVIDDQEALRRLQPPPQDFISCRRPRSMPTMRRIVRHWGAPEDADPFCFRCLRGAARWEDLDRAHLIDRAAGGLDAPQNLMPLCHACHRQQPLFVPGDEDAARAWFAPTTPSCTT